VCGCAGLTADGKLQADMDIQITDGMPEKINAKAELTELSQTVDGKKMTIPQPITLDAQITTADQKLKIDNVQVNSSFCQVQCKGTTEAIDYTVAADLEDSTATSVRFGSQGLEEVARALDEMDYEYLIVGWYHSHPGFTTFLSDKDMETQKKNFHKPFHATIVIDPVNKQFRSYKVIENQYIEKRFLLYEQSALERELTAKRRSENLVYLDALVQRQIRPGQRPEPLVVPNPKASDTSSRLPAEVRQAIETDIQRMINEQDRRRELRKREN